MLDKIKKRMDDLDIKQVDIAKLLNITQPNASRRLSGQTEFTYEELGKLEDLLGIRLLDRSTHPIVDDPGISLVLESLTSLSDRDRQELYFAIALLLEGKLEGTQRKHLCGSLRTLSHT